MTTCRTCKSDRLYLFLPLGDHPLANGFLREEQLSESEALFPLDVHVCLDCGLIQVADQVPAEYFRHYVYIPSAAEAMHGHFAGLAGSLEKRFLGTPDALGHAHRTRAGQPPDAALAAVPWTDKEHQ